MSRFESNPFDEDTASNPYADATVPAAPSSSFNARTTAPQSGTASYFDKAVDTTSAPPEGPALKAAASSSSKITAAVTSAKFDAASNGQLSPRALKKKQQELQNREAQLRKMEKELAQREEAVGVARPNWPPFWPIIRHNIPEDIPEHLRATQRLAFFSWLGAITALTYNFVAITISWILGGLNPLWGIGSFFMALVFLILGVPLSYFLWYRRLYNSFKNDSSLGLVLFFWSYGSHIMWFTVFTIAPPIFWGGYFLTGVLTTIGMFGSSNTVPGILYLVGTVLFGCEVALSVTVIGRVWAYFRRTGKADRAKQEAALTAIAIV